MTLYLRKEKPPPITNYKVKEVKNSNDLLHFTNYHEREDDEDSKLIRMGQSNDKTKLDQVHEALKTCLDSTHNTPDNIHFQSALGDFFDSTYL